MEKAASGFSEFEQTLTGICAVPDWSGKKYCGWKTRPCLTDVEASALLNKHIEQVHSNSSVKIGYVNLTPIINRLRL